MSLGPFLCSWLYSIAFTLLTMSSGLFSIIILEKYYLNSFRKVIFTKLKLCISLPTSWVFFPEQIMEVFFIGPHLTNSLIRPGTRHQPLHSPVLPPHWYPCTLPGWKDFLNINHIALLFSKVIWSMPSTVVDPCIHWLILSDLSKVVLFQFIHEVDFFSKIKSECFYLCWTQKN